MTAPLSQEYDNGVAGQEDQPEDDVSSNNLYEVPSTVSKLQKIVCAVHSSPQHHWAWLQEVEISMQSQDDTLPQTALMLILDKVIDDFVAKTQDLRQYKLTSKDWSAIQLVSDWLKAF
ncbi:uncharacterized protein EDB93DRAFT_1100466 [Suillus bovinus]|uniref:uncharacterized protein n=1 Tax=Suillus bovinus TaxID=48563 RepID=UPI001B872FF7|nr:uncharacterized protein EDB93DRAFT_1100466 [Suillus bovinus]KAG2158252.1 hypothetical protein EDB93DRAFT_1100466 [Suillus bovinus]